MFSYFSQHFPQISGVYELKLSVYLAFSSTFLNIQGRARLFT